MAYYTFDISKLSCAMPFYSKYLPRRNGGNPHVQVHLKAVADADPGHCGCNIYRVLHPESVARRSRGNHSGRPGYRGSAGNEAGRAWFERPDLNPLCEL